MLLQIIAIFLIKFLKLKAYCYVHKLIIQIVYV